jgi:hypothetical protein
MAKGQMTEGEQEGAALVASDYAKGVSHVIATAGHMWKNQHEYNPYTIKTYHKNAGSLFGQSTEAFDVLSKTPDGQSVFEFITEQITNNEVAWHDLDKTIMSDILEPQLQSLVAQLPESRAAREMGFGKTVIPVVEKLKASWYDHYGNVVKNKNKDLAIRVVEDHLESGDYGLVMKLLSQKSPEDLADGFYKEFWSMNLDPSIDRRKFLFNTFQNWALHKAIPSKSLGSVYTQAIEDQISNLNRLSNLKEQGSGFRVGDYRTEDGVMPYGRLRLHLDGLLTHAKANEAEVDAANKVKVRDTILNLAMINAQTMSEHLSSRGEEKIVARSSEQIIEDVEKGGLTAPAPDRTEKVEGDFVWELSTNPQKFMQVFHKLLKDGKLKNSEGESITIDDLDEVTQHSLHSIEANEALLDAMGKYNDIISNKHKNRAAANKVFKEKLEQDFSEHGEIIRNYLKSIAGGKWTDANFFTIFRQMRGSLEELNQNSQGIMLDIPTFRKELLSKFRDELKDTYIAKPAGTRQPVWDFLNKKTIRLKEGVTTPRGASSIVEVSNFQRLKEMPEIDRVQALSVLDVADPAIKPKILAILKDASLAEAEAMDVASLPTLQLFEFNRTMLYGKHPALHKAASVNKFKHSSLSPSVRLMLGESPFELRLIKEMNEFMIPQYRNLVRLVHREMRDGEKATLVLEQIMKETRDGPVTFRNPEGEEIQALTKPLWIQFDEKAKDKGINPRSGKPYTWQQWIANEIMSQTADPNQ